MDSDHREQTERNELYSAWAGLVDWWRQNRERINKWLTVLLLVLAVVAGLRLWNYRTRMQKAQAWSDLAAATSPKSLAGVARDTEIPMVRALAHLRAGDLLLEKWLAPLTAGSPRPRPNREQPDPKKPENGMKRAQAHYEKVLAVEKAPTSVHLAARLGLASVAENRGAWDAAKKQYERVIEAAGDRRSALAERARARLDRLDAVREPVSFATTQPAATRPAATAPEATGPATQPATRP